MLGVRAASAAGVVKKAGIVEDNKAFIYAYLAFGCAACIAYQSYPNLGLSTFITLAVAFQFLAYSLLVLKVVQQQSVRGISGKALACHAVVYCSRLSSTTWLKGYIPADGTGNGLYQALDIMSLAMVLTLLFFIHKRHKDTYQREEDTFEIGYLLSACLFLAVILHPDLNSRPLFDTLWTFALYVDVFAMMPQLWMVSKIGSGGELEALNAHYIAAISLSRGVNLVCWYYAFQEFAPKDGGFNYSGWTIMIASVIQVLLLSDFVYFYFKACFYGCASAVQTGQYSQAQPKMNTFDL